MNQPLISTIITTYKRPAEMLIRAIRSVLSQTYENIELIVVDDSPSDFPGRDDVKKLVLSQEKTVYIPHEKNMGACIARNTGVQHAQGEFVAFLDDDDEWLPTKLAAQMARMADEGVGIVYCNHYRIDDARGTRRIMKVAEYRGYVFDQLILDNFIGSTSFPLLRKACVVESGGFDPLMKASQDYDLWLRIAEKHKVEYVDEYLINYFVHIGDRITGDPTNVISGRYRIIEKHLEYLKQHPRAYARKKLVITPNYIQNRQYLKGFGLWLSAAFFCPQSVKDNVIFLIRDLKWLLIMLSGRNRVRVK